VVQRLKTLQLNPRKNDGNVDQDKYGSIRDAIIQTREGEDEMSYTKLAMKGLKKMK
jgi:hypothetical protein